MRLSFSTRRFGVAVAVLAAGLAFGTTTSSASAGPDGGQSAAAATALASTLRAQTEANHLSSQEARSLQGQVDQVVARTGGTQVAINRVVWDGGDTLIPLPGEAVARELGATTLAGDVYGCHYYQFCTYQTQSFTGMVDRMSSCTWHYTPSWFASYVNNQTPGLRAKFYDHGKHYLAQTMEAPFHGTTSFGGDTYWIVPC
ncbi:hypothetical protein E0H73_38675 [Kribbella pittospori]|uniref:Peptidase inhibitor family I36 protein n=1 Tax=Kribbella pittospori TaxID=722689 RepID=A0A4V2M989_9ACTN|nr:hypothetical protein [Kribbella pittospori]TCC54382.1 hypothetical protein E0H73_38675 [Kribbella pittospori]